jgi:hypothetical protein
MFHSAGVIPFATDFRSGVKRQRRKTADGSHGETRAPSGKSRLKGGCSQDWLPHKAHGHIMRSLLFLGFAVSLHPQITGGVGYSAAVPLLVSNLLTENFDATTPSSQWTISSDLTPSPGPALGWYSAGGNPGFRFANYGHGGASAPWAVGAGAFNLSFNQVWSSGIVPGAAGIAYQAAIPTLNGSAVCISTDPLGSQTSSTWNICYQANG